MANTDYGDISPRTAVYASKDLLERAMPYLCLEHFGQGKPLPTNSSDTVKFRRYERFPITPNALTEGVTPDARQLTKTDITAVLGQYGDLVTITDKVVDTHEDPVLSEATDVLSEQAAQMIETVRYQALLDGSNVDYANGSARNQVNPAFSKSQLRRITRTLKQADAKKISRVIRSTASYGTANVNAAYFCIMHPNCEADVRDLAGFTPVEDYGQLPSFEGEVGKCEDVRFIASTIFEAIPNAGAAHGGVVESTGGTLSDVYPMFFFGRDAYGIVPLKGKTAITPMVVNPKPSDSDPLAQRGHVGWKCYQTAEILNNAWFVQAEVAVTAL